MLEQTLVLQGSPGFVAASNAGNSSSEIKREAEKTLLQIFKRLKQNVQARPVPRHGESRKGRERERERKKAIDRELELEPEETTRRR